MKPAIVMPMSDPHGNMFRHLKRILPDLKTLFDTAVLSIPFETERQQKTNCTWLRSNEFFDVLSLGENTPVGTQFLTLYQFAIQVCSPDQVLHLCYPDRVAYALQGPYQQQYMTDIELLDNDAIPMIFQRSTQAWHTHPTNYRRLELMVTELGEVLFNQTLDFAWCHLAVKSQDLMHILPKIKHPEMAMVAEIVVHLRDRIHTKDVNWLSWEDPFVLDVEAEILKVEREKSSTEVRKRLNYVLPMLQLLKDAYGPF
jgi:hypothetical protein